MSGLHLENNWLEYCLMTHGLNEYIQCHERHISLCTTSRSLNQTQGLMAVSQVIADGIV